MRWKSANGLTLVELIVMVAVLFVLALALVPSVTCNVLQANMTAVGVRGKDICMAVTEANTERVPLGLPPLWPRDFDPAVDTNIDALAELDFDTSTAYFKWLIDEPHLDTPQWSPHVAGVDYSKFAGAGVPACPNRKLTATNNLWTVVKNVRPDMDGVIPVLVTRNIDASSLAARVTEGDLKTKSLRFDPAWKTPFSDKGYVMIRKGGAIFKARSKYMSYRVTYQNQTFDTTQMPDGRSAPPLKYLTPAREVVLNDKAYAEEVAVAYRLAGGWWGQFKRDAQDFFAGVWPFSLFFAIFYLPVFAYNVTRRKRLGLSPATSAPIIGVWICHGFAVTFYAACLFGHDGNWPWVYIGVALVAQVLGIALALVFQRHDCTTRRRQVIWMLLVPIQIAAVLVLSSLFCCVCV